MARNFGIATGRKIVGGFDQSSGPHYAQTTPRDLSSPAPLPRGSILKPFEFSKPLVYELKPFDVALIGFVIAFALGTALGLLFIDL
jgi:hypothetical protein